MGPRLSKRSRGCWRGFGEGWKRWEREGLPGEKAFAGRRVAVDPASDNACDFFRLWWRSKSSQHVSCSGDPSKVPTSPYMSLEARVRGWGKGGGGKEHRDSDHVHVRRSKVLSGVVAESTHTRGLEISV